MTDLVHQGKVRYIARPIWRAGRWQTPTTPPAGEALSASPPINSNGACCPEGPRATWPGLPPFRSRRGRLPGLGVGMLTGKYARGEPFPSGYRMSLGLPYFNRMVTDENST